MHANKTYQFALNKTCFVSTQIKDTPFKCYRRPTCEMKLRFFFLVYEMKLGLKKKRIEKKG